MSHPLFIILVVSSIFSESTLVGRESKEFTKVTDKSLVHKSSLEKTPVQLYGGLSVLGNKIVDKTSKPVSLAGNSLFWSNDHWNGEKFYNKEVVKYLKSDWGSSIIRISMGVEDDGGYIKSPKSNLHRVQKMVDIAIHEGLYVIIDWHSHNAHLHTDAAVLFFKKMAKEYGEHPNVIYEIYNEPLNVSWTDDIKPYAETVIGAIREVDPDNLIIVGTPNWSQDVDVASQSPIKGFVNIAYAFHFYAGTHGQKYREKVKMALKNGIALVCTEWGTVSANGDGDLDIANTKDWIDLLREHQMIHCNWAVNNKAEGSSVFIPNTNDKGPWSDADLTKSGQLVRSIIKSWDSDK